VLGLRTLILNADYQPKNILKLSTITVEEAITDIVLGNCTVIDTYNRAIKTVKEENRFNIPSVIAYKRYFKRLKGVPLHTNLLLLRDNYACVYCGIELSENSMTWDHYHPVSAGGDTSWNNILSSCHICNHSYGRTPAKQKKPSHKPYEPSYNKLVTLRRHRDMVVDHESWIQWLGPWYADIQVL
jgi:hypothetical protein